MSKRILHDENGPRYATDEEERFFSKAEKIERENKEKKEATIEKKCSNELDEILKGYKNCDRKGDTEEILLQLIGADLLVVKTLIERYLDMERWINDVKSSMKAGSI